MHKDNLQYELSKTITAVRPRKVFYEASQQSGCFHALLVIALTPIICLPSGTPPAINSIYTSSAGVVGGRSTGPGGVVFFSTLSGAGNARVTALNSNNSLKWEWISPTAGTAGNIYGIPAVDAAGQKVYFGSDAGVFYCLDTSTGQAPVGWVNFTVPIGTDRRIRSGAALDPNNPAGPTVYFQSNNGNLYALDATTGNQRWVAQTANQGAPVDATYHPQPVSSSPVVASGGTIYVGSSVSPSEGRVYSFSPSGALNSGWPVALSEPIEATMAIGANGLLYVATRAVPGNNVSGRVRAIDPTTRTVTWVNDSSDNTVGYVASPVIDQVGYVYGTVFGGTHEIRKIDPSSGGVLQLWYFSGKLCQTPSINQNGLLIVGVSAIDAGEVSKIAAININDPTTSTAFWEITQVGGQSVGMFLGSPVIKCVPNGIAYIADATYGKVYRFDSGAPMMAGQWPTFQCGNRRAGKTLTYPSVIAELGPFVGGDGNYYSVVRNVDPAGRAAGQSYGSYGYACSQSGIDYAAAYWINNGIRYPGACYQGSPQTSATALNGLGDVAGYWTWGPLVWPNGVNTSTPFVQLSTPNFSGGQATDINSAGNIVGFASNGGVYDVFSWTKSGPTTWNWQDLGTTPGGQAYGYSITEIGRIIGKAKFVSGGPFHAFLLPQESFTMSLAVDLGTLGGIASEAWDVDDGSGTAGRSQNSAGYWRAFYLPLNCTVLSASYELPPLPSVTRTDYTSAAYGVNKVGHVVGTAQNQGLMSRAFVYKPGQGGMIDLNTQLAPGSPWILTQAQAINDAGIMVGSGTYNGQSTSWIIYPQCQD